MKMNYDVRLIFNNKQFYNMFNGNENFDIMRKI